MRGAPVLLGSIVSNRGIIPAYAGSTVEKALIVPPPRDHPRVCGEHSSRSEPRRLCPGSSPRMRGAPCRQVRRPHQRGIIPAYAGSTPTSSSARSTGRDHPRVCGEHTTSSSPRRGTTGSSPRMRGAHLVINNVSHSAGIIPAYAGSTRSRIGLFTA